MDEEDAIKLYETVKQHFYFTKSAAAKKLLENWSQATKQFVKVCFDSQSSQDSLSSDIQFTSKQANKQHLFINAG